jgi:hypothetical protein
MAKCIAQKKSDGQTCGKTCKDSKLYCGTHDPSRPKKRKATHVEKVRRLELLEIIAKQVNYIPDEETQREIAMQKCRRTFVYNHVDEEVAKIIRGDVAKLAHLDVAKEKYPTDESVFPRRVWSRIGLYLEKDLKTLSNLAMTCKDMYALLVRGKVPWYHHPLKMMKSPQCFFYPIFRIVEFVIPDELDAILAEHNLPSVAVVESEHTKSLKKPPTPLEELQNKADVISHLCRTLIESATYVNGVEDEEFGAESTEEIPGGGIYGDVKRANLLRFENPKFKFKTLMHKGVAYVMIAPLEDCSSTRLERYIKESIVSYDGKRLIRLMKV